MKWVPKNETLIYDSSETAVIGYLLSEFKSSLNGMCHAQMHMLQTGLKIFKEEGVRAAKIEVGQMHHRTCF